jgi:heme/copper-type cytochrome/quinol oxidase subunit 3
MRLVNALCLVFGAIALSCYACLFLMLMPVERAARDFAALVREPLWMPLACLAMLGLALLTIGLLAVVRDTNLKRLQRELTLAIIAIALLLNFANLTWEAFVFPAIAKDTRAVFVLNDGIIRDFVSVRAFHMLRIVVSALALGLFVRGTWRARTYATPGGALVGLGLCALTFEAMLAPQLVVAGALALCAGGVVLGRDMMAGPICKASDRDSDEMAT